MKIVSLITARGGSKGIHRKNLIEINGKPLISYAIKASFKSLVDETWVSTDDNEIAQVSYKYGAKVIKRPLSLSDDIIMPDAALCHFAEKKEFDLCVFIQPTSPLIKSKYINQAVFKMEKESYDSIFTIHKSHWLPKWTIDKRMCIPLNWDLKDRPRRQDIENNVVVENGMFYISKRQNILESRLRYSGRIGTYEIPLIDSFGIDSMNDVEIIKRII